MTVYTLTGDATHGYNMLYFDASSILGILGDGATTATGNNTQRTFTNATSGAVLIANGSFSGADPDGYPTSGTVTSFTYTWSPDGYPITISGSGFTPINVATLYNWVATFNFEALHQVLFEGDDTITGTDQADSIRGFRGNDTINAGGGDDYISLNFTDGHDIIDGGAGYDIARLEFGSPFSQSTALSYIYNLGAMATNTGVTLADGTSVRNVEATHINSAGGDDTFIAAVAAVDMNFGLWLDGGDGVDTLQCDFTGSGLAVANSAFSPGLAGQFLGYTIMNIERYLLTGSDVDDLLRGAALDDVLNGGLGSDWLGGAGGNDALNGGAGIDTAAYEYEQSVMSWHRNPNGSWTVIAPNGTDTVTNVEWLEFAVFGRVHLDRPASNFSADGVSDFLLRNQANGSTVIWSNASNAAGAGVGTVSTDWAISGTGDFNGDGRDDILWRNNTSGDMAMWFMNQAATTGSAGFGVGLSWNISGVGDVNGDGRDDIVWRNTNGDLILWFMNGGAITGAGLGNVSNNWAIEVLGDFNGDGRDDFIWRNTTTGDMSMWLMNGAAASAATFANVGSPWEIAGVGDLNMDGRDDVIWRNSATGDVSLWFMNGGSIQSSTGFGVGAAWDVASVGDYNGNGTSDIVWRNSTTNDVIVWYMSGAAVTGSAFLGNLGADWVITPGG